MKNPQSSHAKTVAVVGTGMAGLATAHLLHQDSQKRYQVTLIEKVGAFRLHVTQIQRPMPCRGNVHNANRLNRETKYR
jgi:2-polyprenyl-6-methoxyphenol hydroxylase-like FAD-dependent oxidoreductase